MTVICTELLREPLQWLAKADDLTCQSCDAPTVYYYKSACYKFQNQNAAQHNILGSNQPSTWSVVCRPTSWSMRSEASYCHRAGGSRCNPVAACWPSNLQCWHRFDNCHTNYVPLCCHCEIVLYISYVVRTYCVRYVGYILFIPLLSVYGTNLLK